MVQNPSYKGYTAALKNETNVGRISGVQVKSDELFLQ
jgi:hypothetical protein